ncbi:hypothetical protein TheetDRAFT_3364 [Thermoanaerobacter ethanolicus JW 200]|nr:hypothetical protein TheetDRAFT_3364 [Thermoanaerobacter ethanolicus JW 200]
MGDNLRNDILMRLKTIKGHIAGIEKNGRRVKKVVRKFYCR